MQPCRSKTTLALALGLATILVLALAVPAAASSPLRAVAATPEVPGTAPAAPIAGASTGPARIVAPSTVNCAGGLVFDDGETDEAIQFDDAGNPAEGLPVDAVMRFDLTDPEARFLEQMCVCWNRTGPATGPDTFDHDLVFFRADGPGGAPGTVIATIPFQVTNPPAPNQTVFFEYDLVPDEIEIAGSTVYAGVRWTSPDPGNPGLALCIDQDGPGNQPMWLRIAPPTASEWVTTDEVFNDPNSGVSPPPTALMFRLELTPELVETCPATPCIEDATTLCLNQDRFRVEADWRTALGTSGPAMAGNPLTDDTGYFWFFNEANVEVVVKALNGCGVNGHYWIFTSGLTNVEVEMRVCDTVEGVQRTYFNPLNVSFQPILDTAAFETCP